MIFPRNESLQERSVEWARQQRACGFALNFALQIGERDGNIAAEFPNNLPARAARWSENFGVAYDGDGIEVALPLGNRLENSDSLGAQRQPERRVLDVASLDYFPGFCSQRGAEAEFLVWRVCFFAGGARGFDQFLLIAHSCTSLS